MYQPSSTLNSRDNCFYQYAESCAREFKMPLSSARRLVKDIVASAKYDKQAADEYLDMEIDNDRQSPMG